MPLDLNPNSKVIASTFIRSIYGESAPANFGVGGTLPEDQNSWSAGFVQVTVVGGSPDVDVPTRKPIVQVDCWVPSINSSKPQWGRASTIAENLVQYFYTYGDNVQAIVTANSYKNALVQSVYAISEPREVTNDPAGHARVTFDIVLTWKIS